jgi:thiamine biosynthesis lipoprotein
MVSDPHVLLAATDLLHAEIDQLDRVASRFRPDSEIAQVERSEGRAVAASPVLLELMDVALGVARATDGKVDPTVGRAMIGLGYDRDFADVAPGVAGRLPAPAAVPGWRSIGIDRRKGTIRVPAGTHIDLGATAKSWAADRIAALVLDRVGCGVMVSLGGDVAVAGPPPPEGFRVALGDVSGAGENVGTVAIATGGLATSGIAVRYWRLGGDTVHHIVDPATGLPAPSCWRTVTVAAGSCVDANAASTAVMVLGRSAVPWLEDRGLPARLVAVNGAVSCLNGWPGPGDQPGSKGPSGAPGPGRP